MNKEKLGQDPAFPYVEEKLDNVGILYNNTYPGISTRLYLAGKAMQGLCSTELQGITIKKAKERMPEVVKLALAYADELLKQEGE